MSYVALAFFRAIDALISFTITRPKRTLVVSLLATAAVWGYATRLQLKSDLRELLPRDSAEYQAYEKQALRAPTGATILVLARSENAAANALFIETLAGELRKLQANPRAGIKVVDANNQAAHQFFQRNKWLYAPLAALQDADAEVGRAIAIKSGLVEDLQSDGDAQPQTTGEVIQELRRRRSEAERHLR
jgi:predicted exporter